MTNRQNYMDRFLDASKDYDYVCGGTMRIAMAYHEFVTHSITLDSEVDGEVCEPCHLAMHHTPDELSELLADSDGLPANDSQMTALYHNVEGATSVCNPDLTSDQLFTIFSVTHEWPASTDPYSSQPCDTCFTNLGGARWPVMLPQPT